MKGLPSFLGGKYPFDYMQTGLTRGLEVSASSRDIARGDELVATVTITDPGRLGDLELGPTCKESYAAMERRNGNVQSRPGDQVGHGVRDVGSCGERGRRIDGPSAGPR